MPYAARLLATTLLASTALLLHPGAARAEEDSAVRIPIRVQVIAASRSPGGVDPKLEALRTRLEDFAFASYRMVEETSVESAMKSSTSLPLPGGRTMAIVPLRFASSGKLRVHVTVKSPKQRVLVDAEYDIEPGGDLLVGGMKYKDGALLVAIHHGQGAGKR